MSAPTQEELHAQRQRRQAEARRLQQVSNALIAELHTGDDWRAWLQLGARFAGYGLRNALLISAQAPEATQVADYSTWLRRGRHVERGQHGIRILRPDPPAPISVFDISQTAGPLWQPSVPAADPESHLWPALTHLADRHGHSVQLDGAPDAPAVLELIHELTHLLLGTAEQLCHGARHVEAESVTYLIAQHVGLDTRPITFPAVSTWAGHNNETRVGIIQAFAARIDTTIMRIRSHLDERLPPAPEAAPPVRRVLATPQPRQPEEHRELVAVHQAAQAYYLERLAHGWAPRYLHDRGFPAATRERWGIGWAPPGWDNLLTHLRGLGYTDQLIEAAGLARRTKHDTLIDTFRDRVTLPVRSPDGAIIAFIGRAGPHAPGDTPKYLNSSETALYKKGDCLIGLHEAQPRLQQGGRPVIVEGAFDAIAITMASTTYAPVAPSGTALTKQQCQLLARHAPQLDRTGIAVALDGDQAGRRAAVKAYERLTTVTRDLTAIVLPDGSDPAGILQDHGPESLARALDRAQRPLIDLVVDARIEQWRPRLDTAEGQIAALRAIAPDIAALPPQQITRNVARLTDLLGITHGEVTQAIADAISPPPLAGADHPDPTPNLVALPAASTAGREARPDPQLRRRHGPSRGY